MKGQRIGIIALCLIAGCKAMYNDNRQLPNPKCAGTAQTNDVFVKLHITNQPPEKVTVKIEATNSTPTIEMQVKVDAKQPQEAAVPLKLDVTATNNNPVRVSIALSNSSSLYVPVTLSTDAVKEITIPIKVKVDASSDPSEKISSGITIKMNDDFKTLLKRLCDHSSDEHPEMKPSFTEGTWFRRHEWLVDFFILFSIVVFSGAVGGLLRTVVDDDTEFLSNIIFGITAALLVPIALYSKERKIFELGIKDSLLLLILVSASIAAGLIGAVFVQWFYRTATRMFQSRS